MRGRHAAAAALALGALTGLAAAPAYAQAVFPEWVVDVGAVARTRPTRLGARDLRSDVMPVIEASLGDRLTLSLDDGVKWVALRGGVFEAGPIAEYRQSFNDDLPVGAFKMADAVELGAFAQATTTVGRFEGRLRRAVNGYQGWSGDLAYDVGKQLAPRLEAAGQLRLAWADSNFSQEYFGLRPHAARRFGLPQFLDEDYLAAGGEFDLSRDVTPRMRLIMALSADHILGEPPVSPLLHTRDIYVAAVGVTYRWSTRGDAR